MDKPSGVAILFKSMGLDFDSIQQQAAAIAETVKRFDERLARVETMQAQILAKLDGAEVAIVEVKNEKVRGLDWMKMEDMNAGTD